ncbi:hypothetical protein [Vacuolonema iberomarrocanum]|uniref:hypothetical protein n=1 Tax=Vacuolonema iberomarrocanum TaxID=3454632 RepID=UPI0019E0FAE0|nr:hypothetical protein [filamentous cyanobacterium LEGE 07170]
MTTEPTVFQTQQPWTITRAGKTYRVRFEQVGNHFTGHYVDLDNPSRFLGDVVTGIVRTNNDLSDTLHNVIAPTPAHP